MEVHTAILCLGMPTLCIVCNAARAHTLDEIVVTARKVEERHQDVPLSTDVLGGEELTRGSIASLQALAARVPGLSYDAAFGGSLSHTVMRGQQQATLAGDNVGIFVDGVYQANQDLRDVEMLDVERVEVVRGPQGTLFGHSTFAGAIHFVSAEPTAALDTGVDIERGTDAYRALRGWISGPVTGVVAGRLAIGYRAADGMHPNAAGSPDLGSFERIAGAARFSTADSLPWRASLSLRYLQSNSGSAAYRALDYADFNCGGRIPSPAAWSYFCGAAPVDRGFDLSTDLPDSAGRSRQAALELSIPIAGLTLDSQTTWYSGAFAAIRDTDASSAGDLFGVCTIGRNCTASPDAPQPVNRVTEVNVVDEFATRTEEFFQELRLHSAGDGALEWMLGGYAYRTTSRFLTASGATRGDLAPTERLTAYLPAAPLRAGPLSILNSALVDDPATTRLPRNGTFERRLSWGAMGMLTYRLGDAVRLRGEARAARERVDLQSLYDSFRASSGPPLDAVELDDLLPRVSIEYRQSENVRWYISHAKGARSGGINATPNLIADERQYAPEWNWTTELGLRHRSPGMLRLLDLTAFHIDWHDTQIQGFSNSPGVAGLVIRNTAGIRTDGLEASLGLRVTDWLSVDAAFTWIDARFRDGSDSPGDTGFCGLDSRNRSSTFCTVGPPRVAGGNGPGVVPWIDGREPARAPSRPWHIGASIEARHALLGWRSWLRADLSFQDDVADRPVGGLYYGERALLDTRLGFSRRGWSLEIWARNLTDTRYVSVAVPGFPAYFPTTPRPIDLLQGDGRRIGMTVRFDYDADH